MIEFIHGIVPTEIADVGVPAVPVAGPLTDAELRATPVPVSGPLTDMEIRATPVPVSGNITAVADPRQQFSQFGELMAVTFSPQAAWRFNYGIIDKLFTKTETNGGTVTTSGDKAQIATGTNTAGLARVETIRRIRYLPGVGGEVKFTAVWTAGVADSHQIIGVGDTVDRLFIGYWGTDFVAGRQRGGAGPTTNVIVPPFNPLVGNVFKITFGWLGYQGAVYSWYNPATRVFEPLYYLDYANTSADVYILNPTLPLFAEAANTGNNTNLVLQTPSAVGGAQGYPGDEIHNPLNVDRPFDVSATYANTSNNKILSIKNKATAFSGPIANRVPIAIKSIELSRSSAGAATSIIRIYNTPVTTPADPLVFTDVDTNNSPAATNVTTTTITTGTSDFTYSLSANKTDRTILYDNGQFILYPGDIMTIAVQNSGVQSTDFIVTVNWEERF